MERLDKATEQRVLESLESAVRMTNAGMPPDDAIFKTANEQGFGAPLVRRMTEAYNVSRTLAHMKNVPPEKRAESFPLADAAKILEKMYPSAPKTAAVLFSETSVDFDALPGKEKNFTFKKVADTLPDWKKSEAYPRDPAYATGRWFAKRDQLAKAAEHTRMEFTSAHDKMMDAAERVGDYFRGLNHEPFAIVEKRAYWEFGNVVGKALMDTIYALGNIKEKRAEAASTTPMVFDVSKSPYSLVSTTAKWAKMASAYFVNYAKAAQDLEKHGENPPMLPAAEKSARMLDEVLETGAAPRPFEFALPVGLQLEKEGIDITSLLAGKGITDVMTGLAGNADPERLKARAKEQIMDPQHDAELATARVKAMMSDFMSNDEVLASYPQEQVATAYNQLAQLAPTAAQQPAVMRGLLRKMVQQGGVIEPFEAHQLGKIETGLRGKGVTD